MGIAGLIPVPTYWRSGVLEQGRRWAWAGGRRGGWRVKDEMSPRAEEEECGWAGAGVREKLVVLSGAGECCIEACRD